VTDSVKTAASQLEAFFVRQLLAEARPKGGMLDGGFAGDTFSQMLDEAIADKIAGAGGLGMAPELARHMGGGKTATSVGTPEFGPHMDGLPNLAMPVAGHLTSRYGHRVGHDGTTHMHQGLDLAAKMGTPVTAAAAGTVVEAGAAGNYGNLVRVRHADGFETRYAHLSAIGVKVGDKVEPGQQLGNVGSTGLSDGPHLHFELRKAGAAVDPVGLLPLNKSAKGTTR
jgi:murein DD-endopeptidase MepM/ murein hydrolase activator NlpD